MIGFGVTQEELQVALERAGYNTYSVPRKCSNCGWRFDQSFPKGTAVQDVLCPKCGCTVDAGWGF